MTINQYASSKNGDLVAVNIIAIYNTICYKPYSNIFIKENREYYGICHTIMGEGALQIDGKVYNLKANQIIMGKHSQIDRIECISSEWEFNFYWFTLYNFDLPLNEIFDISYSEYEKESTSQIIRFLNNDDDISTIQANALCLSIIAYWIKTIGFRNTKVDINFKIIKDSVLYINENLDKELKVNDLASLFGFSDKHYRFLFSQYIGVTPKKYVMKVKLDRAINLLRFTAMSIEEISDELNFSSQFHFMKAFREKYGISPAKFKKQLLITIDEKQD